MLEIGKASAILSLRFTPVANDKERPCVGTRLPSNGTRGPGTGCAANPIVWLSFLSLSVTGETRRRTVAGFGRRETPPASALPALWRDAVARVRSYARNDNLDSSTY